MQMRIPPKSKSGEITEWTGLAIWENLLAERRDEAAFRGEIRTVGFF